MRTQSPIKTGFSRNFSTKSRLLGRTERTWFACLAAVLTALTGIALPAVAYADPSSTPTATVASCAEIPGDNAQHMTINLINPTGATVVFSYGRAGTTLSTTSVDPTTTGIATVNDVDDGPPAELVTIYAGSVQLPSLSCPTSTPTPTPSPIPTTTPTPTGTPTASPTPAATATPAPATLTSSTLAAGNTDTITATGFTPGEPVTAVLHSTPYNLGTTSATTTGHATLTFTIPTTTDPGAHTITLTGQTSHHTTTTPLTITASPTAPSTTPSATALASTGASDLGQLITGSVIALLLGLTTLTIARHRRTRSTT